jgi:hypothetical protein
MNSNEPVAWMKCNTGSELSMDWLPNTLFQKLVIEDKKDWIPLYTHSFKDLPDDEIDAIENAVYCKTIQKGKTPHEYIMKFARALLQRASEK